MCISDTHNTTPNLPPGDITVHAGDLTAYGTFDEVQAQLYWLSSRPHTHKVFIAGNHDLILDEASNMKFLTREGISSAKRKELDWIGIHYLQDEAVTLELPVPSSENIRVSNDARNFAFGPLSILRSATCGQGGSPDDTDILVHGPPALYGDCDGAFGAAVIHHDGIEDVMNGLQIQWEGYNMAGAHKKTLWSKITMERNAERPGETLVINAAVAPSAPRNEEAQLQSISTEQKYV
ncbi:hypothetical protein LT330_009104 [Penicillium expansum]|nr:hypothetical protein LT330_009104 [Penicillium expansum]